MMNLDRRIDEWFSGFSAGRKWGLGWSKESEATYRGAVKDGVKSFMESLTLEEHLALAVRPLRREIRQVIAQIEEERERAAAKAEQERRLLDVMMPATTKEKEGGHGMTIAVLGWGSLIWNPGCLRLADGNWHPDGPVLPIEFARISGGGEEPERLTLTLREGAQGVPTLWAESELNDLDAARANLAQRENCQVERIGCVSPDGRSRLRAITDPTAARELLQRIDGWRAEKGFEAVIWTDLKSNFESKRRDEAGGAIALTPAAAVAYLQELVRSEAAAAAEKYIRCAPEQVQTDIRHAVETALGWTAESEPARGCAGRAAAGTAEGAAASSAQTDDHSTG